VKKKKEELLQQLYHEPRYTRGKELASDYRLTLHSATAEATTAKALVSIAAPETIPASGAAPVATVPASAAAPVAPSYTAAISTSNTSTVPV
jgi:hypothetical protein